MEKKITNHSKTLHLLIDKANRGLYPKYTGPCYCPGYTLKQQLRTPTSDTDNPGWFEQVSQRVKALRKYYRVLK